MRNRFYIAVIAGLLVFVASCGNSKDGTSIDCSKKSTEELKSKLFNQANAQYDFYYSKIGVNIKNSDEDNSFKATVKMRIDSAFSGTIKVAGFVGATYLVDQDTVAFTNKIKKCFNKESYSYLSSVFGTDLGYDFMQKLILGQPVGLNDSIEYDQLKSKDNYILSSHNKKTFKKLDTDKLGEDELDNIFIKYYMDCESLTLTKININVPKDSVTIDIDLNETQIVGQTAVPKETAIKIVTPKDSIFINLSYGTTKLNEPRKIRINIPEGYSECE
jgi:hypothetical protein